MLMTRSSPVTLGEILVEEFMKPSGLTQNALAGAMGVPRSHIEESCSNCRKVTAEAAKLLGNVFGNTPEFWLNVQYRNDR